MAQRIGKYKISKKEARLSTIDSVTPGGAIDGDLSGMDSISSATLTTTGVVTVNGNLKGGTNAGDNTFVQFDGTEVARIHDGGVTPTNTGTSTSLTAGTGFGYRRRVLTLGSGNDNNVLTLTAADCGAVIFVTPTNAVSITLPLVGTETGLWFTIVLADKINKAFTVKTTGQDGNDNILLQNTSTVGEATTPFTFDVGGGHDVLTLTNMLEGSRIDLVNVAGGAAETWLANVISTDTVLASIA